MWLTSVIVNILKGVFVGSKAYNDAMTKIEKAATTYTSFVSDLDLAIGIESLRQGQQTQDSVVQITKQIEQFELSTQSQSRDIQYELQAANRGIEQLRKENDGTCLLPC